MSLEAMRVWPFVVISLSMLAVPALHATEPAGAKPDTSSTPSVRKGRVPHLRFKDGPVCMCGYGLTEADIEKAAKARQEKEKKSNATGVDQRSKRREQ
jgi:hypothetical protein